MPPVVGQKFCRNPVLAGCAPVHFQHVFSALAPIQPDPGDIPGVVVYEPDDVGWFIVDYEDRDVALPERIWLGVFVPPVFERLYTPLLLQRRDEPVRFRVLPNCTGAGLHEEQPPEYVRYLSCSMRRLCRLQFNDLRNNSLRQSTLLRSGPPVQKARLAFSTVLPSPSGNRAFGDADLLGDNRRRYPFLCCQLYGLAPYRHWMPNMPPVYLLGPRSPPGGRGGAPPYCLLLLTHGFTPCHALTALGVLPSFTHSSFSLSGR